jgi:hypothetical protein
MKTKKMFAKTGAVVTIIGMVLGVLAPLTVQAAGQLTSRSSTVSSSAAAASGVTYTVKFTLSTSGLNIYRHRSFSADLSGNGFWRYSTGYCESNYGQWQYAGESGVLCRHEWN